MMRKKFDDEVLAKVRAIPIVDALEGLGIYFQPDNEYRPIKNKASLRLMVSATEGFYEILVTPPMKWYDARMKKGGGGAIDLVMHIKECSFVEAVRLLTPLLKR